MKTVMWMQDMKIDGLSIATVDAFIEARTWTESQRVVEEHPELLSPVTDTVMEGS
jgi:hypothetical protein